MEKFACYDFAIQYIKNENKLGTNALNEKPNYKNPDKLTKPMLVKNGDYMQVTKTIEKNENVIKKPHDLQLVGHLKTLKKIEKKKPRKNIKTNVENNIKNCPNCAKKNTTGLAKKIYTNRYNYQKRFSKKLFWILSLGYRNHKTQR